MKKKYVTIIGTRKKYGVCGKVCFDKKTAQTKKKYMEKNESKRLKSGKLRIYACDECDCWHLTSKVEEDYD